jgi:potassium-transporting ATPase potassium-binding subunit
MTINGWMQIAIFALIVVALTKPLGGYMTRVFNGERTLLSPVLRPIEIGLYRLCGVDERTEQHWMTYAVAMLMFSLAGFATLYALQRLQALLPFNPQHLDAVAPDLAFNTAISFVTNTNWQSYVPERALLH